MFKTSGRFLNKFFQNENAVAWVAWVMPNSLNIGFQFKNNFQQVDQLKEENKIKETKIAELLRIVSISNTFYFSKNCFWCTLI